MNAEQDRRYDSPSHGENDAVIEVTQPTSRGRTTLPADALNIVPVGNLVLFPGLLVPINIGHERTLAAAQEATRSSRPVGILLQREPAADIPGPEQLHQIGTTASILRYVTAQDDEHYIVCQGQQRFRIIEHLDGYPFHAARVQLLTEPGEKTPEVQARLLQLKQRSNEIPALLPQVPRELATAAQTISSASAYADFVAGLMDLSPDEKQDILETLDLPQRLDKVLNFSSGSKSCACRKKSVSKPKSAWTSGSGNSCCGSN